MDTRQTVAELIQVGLTDSHMADQVHLPSADVGFCLGLRLARTHPEWAMALVNASFEEYLGQVRNREAGARKLLEADALWGEYINQHPIEEVTE